MDYVALKAEIALPAYNGMTDEQIAAALNTANVTAWVDVRPIAIWGVLLQSGEWGRIEVDSRRSPTANLGSNPTANDTLIGRLATFVRIVQFGDDLPTSVANVRAVIGALLDAFVTSGHISAATRTAIVNLAQRTISRAQQLGLGVVAPGDIATARAT